MGLRYLPVSLDKMKALGDRPAGFFAYLKLRAKYADESGYFDCSITEVKNATGYGRRIQENSRKILVEKHLISYRIKNKRSPTIEYRIIANE